MEPSTLAGLTPAGVLPLSRSLIAPSGFSRVDRPRRLTSRFFTGRIKLTRAVIQDPGDPARRFERGPVPSLRNMIGAQTTHRNKPIAAPMRTRVLVANGAPNTCETTASAATQKRAGPKVTMARPKRRALKLRSVRTAPVIKARMPDGVVSIRIAPQKKTMIPPALPI